MYLAIDYFVPKYSYFVRTPGNEFRPLRVSTSWPDHLPLVPEPILRNLDIDLALTGLLADTDPSIYYETWIARVADDYCVAYRMRPPFAGEFRDCVRKPDSANTVAYSPGLWSWRTAMQRVCERVAKESAGKCGDDVRPGFNLIRRDPGGDLYYVVAVGRALRGRPELAKSPYFLYADSDYFVYRVSATDGQMTLLDHTDKRPDSRYWQKQ